MDLSFPNFLEESMKFFQTLASLKDLYNSSNTIEGDQRFFFSNWDFKVPREVVLNFSEHTLIFFIDKLFFMHYVGIWFLVNSVFGNLNCFETLCV